MAPPSTNTPAPTKEPIDIKPVDDLGRFQIRVPSSPEYYYVLYLRPDLQGDAEWPVSITLGKRGTTTLTEPLAAYPPEHYRVAQIRRDDPADTDGDGIDDLAELLDPKNHSPLNPAQELDALDGAVSIPLSIPEEILLDATTGYTLVRPSNQVADGEQILSEEHLDELRTMLATIHDEFRALYASDQEFAMEVEYKLTRKGKLALKQARPWIFPSTGTPPE